MGEDVWDDETAIEPRTQTVSMGDVVWDVAALIEAAEGKPTVQVPVRWHVDESVVDKSHWRGVDLHTPIILAPHPDTGYLVALDGRHRLYKAYRLGRVTVGAVILTEEEERAARMDPGRIAEIDAAHQAWERITDGR
jgi:hypothetical protein